MTSGELIIIFLAVVVVAVVIACIYYIKTLEINPPIVTHKLSNSDEMLSDAMDYFILIDNEEGYGGSEQL